MKDKLISVRVDSKQLDHLIDLFGLNGCFGSDSKAIQLSLNFTENVIRNLFGSDLKAIFKRNPKDIEQPRY